jgi:hypothetical protein
MVQVNMELVLKVLNLKVELKEFRISSPIQEMQNPRKTNMSRENNLSKILYGIVFLISFLIHNCYAQKLVSYEVKYLDSTNTEDKAKTIFVREYMREKKLCQIYFGNYFKNERIKVYNNKVMIMDTIVSTNLSVGLSDKSIFINSNSQNLMSIRFADSEMLFNYDARYLFLVVEKSKEKTELIYSNNPMDRK